MIIKTSKSLFLKINTIASFFIKFVIPFYGIENDVYQRKRCFFDPGSVFFDYADRLEWQSIQTLDKTFQHPVIYYASFTTHLQPIYMSKK